ncbi:MAG: hypothetical protein ABIJ14_01045 [Nanoarchaeota archaeon]
MVSINWCLKIKNGLELVGPNENMANSYLKMAEESLRAIKNNQESKIWTASTSYYTMYYSLYAVMMKIGVKCEIHKCSIEFMKKFLLGFYSGEDVGLIETAFESRNDLQYYPNQLVNEDKLKIVREGAVDFFVKTKGVLAKINDKQVNEIRKNFEEVRR